MFSHPAIRFVLKRARPHAALMVAILMGELMTAAVSLAIPQIAGASISALMSNALTTLSWTLFAAAGLYLARLAFESWTTFVALNVSNAVERTTRADFHKHLLHLPISDHQRLGISALMDAEFRDLWTVRSLVMSQPPLIIGSLVTAVGALSFAAAISWRMTLLCGLVGPLMYGLVRAVGRRVERMSRDYWQALRAANKIDVENLTVITLVKTYGQLQARHALFDQKLANVVSQARRRNLLNSLYSPISRTLEIFGIAALVYATSQGWLGEKLGAVEIGQFMMYAFLLISPFRTIASLAMQAREDKDAFDRVGEILNLVPETEGTVEIERAEGRVVAQHVSFGYPDREDVLDDVSFELQPGDFVAFTGQNGGGKSTTVALIAGLWRPRSGQLLLDGVDLRDLTFQSLHHNVCLVEQHTEMLDASIEDNLRFVSPDATDEDLRFACHLGLVDQFIDSLPDGLETVIGTSGAKLSGGQRQRIAIARAVLANPRVLLLDEATSMFDPDSEILLLERMRDWLSRRTVVFITHREAPIAFANRIFHIEDYRVTSVDGLQSWSGGP